MQDDKISLHSDNDHIYLDGHFCQEDHSENVVWHTQKHSLLNNRVRTMQKKKKTTHKYKQTKKTISTTMHFLSIVHVVFAWDNCWFIQLACYMKQIFGLHVARLKSVNSFHRVISKNKSVLNWISSDIQVIHFNTMSTEKFFFHIYAKYRTASSFKCIKTIQFWKYWTEEIISN